MTVEQDPPSRRFPFLPEVLSGETADIYFHRSREALRRVHLNPIVDMEIFPNHDCVWCGIGQVTQLLKEAGFAGELWSLAEGDEAREGESVLRLVGPYDSFGIYETAMLGILASCSGWATAAQEVTSAAGDIPVVSFGARHIHPNVASIMDYAAVLGGCRECSTPLGARLAGVDASGTMPHAYLLIVGDTVRAAEAYQQVLPGDVQLTVLVDTFQDEAVESVRVARELEGQVAAVRLDTPSERGGVTPGLVMEVRARLDRHGFRDVAILVSGGVTPGRIVEFKSAGAPVDGYGVGSYISAARPVDHTADLRAIEGKPVAKRGRIPGVPDAPRLQRRM